MMALTGKLLEISQHAKGSHQNELREAGSYQKNSFPIFQLIFYHVGSSFCNCMLSVNFWFRWIFLSLVTKNSKCFPVNDSSCTKMKWFSFQIYRNDESAVRMREGCLSPSLCWCFISGKEAGLWSFLGTGALSNYIRPPPPQCHHGIETPPVNRQTHNWNKKVLLHERKKHTARRVASTPSIVLSGAGVPWGTPSQDRGTLGYPHSDLDRHPPSWPSWGTPHPDLAGEYPIPGQGVP